MQLYLLKSPIIFIILLLIVKISARNLDGFSDSLQSEDSANHLFNSNNEDVNLVDYSAELHSYHQPKNRGWLNVTMTQGTYILASGQSYELKCEASGSPAPDIYWIRDTDVQTQINKLKRRMYNPSNRQTTNMARVESKYIISCASEVDVGSIHCVAISNRFVRKKTANIEIDGSLQERTPCSLMQTPVITKYKQTLVSAQGSTVILPCEVFGDPKPQTYWQIVGDDGTTDLGNHPRIRLLTNGELMIKSLEWDDVGDYTCIANSTLGEDRVTTFIYPVRVDKY